MRRLLVIALAANLLLVLLLHLVPPPLRGPSGSGEAHAQTGLPPLPPGWPTTLQLGMSDQPGGAAAMRATAPFGFRYQYLAGGANTGSGWATWNEDGRFATYYVEESTARGITPVFTYYMIRQSAPGKDMDETAGVLANLQNAATMRAYFEDLTLFFQRAGAFPSTRIVFHVEPDMWGYAQQRSSGDTAATVPACVSATGVADVAGLPNTVAGVAQAVVRLRDRYAPNVQLGYHLSVWGTNVDIQLQDPTNAEVDTLAARATAFYRSLGADFDLLFAEFSDRDSGFKQYVYGDSGASWWDAADFDRNIRFIGKVVAGTNKRVVFWQIPYGNTRMRAMNNTWGHYQDNKVEWLLDDPARANVRRYLEAGAVALLFGGGADGTTCPCDGRRDGVTNPAPINGNAATSLNADDDGGYFRQQASAYYAAGPLALPGTTAPPPPVSCTPRPTFRVQAVAGAPGELRATVAAGVTTGVPSNSIRSIRVAHATNARVELVGRGPIADGQVVQLPSATRELSLTVRRAAPGAATTVPLVLTDDCGEWQTLVGGGASAF